MSCTEADKASVSVHMMRPRTPSGQVVVEVASGQVAGQVSQRTSEEMNHVTRGRRERAQRSGVRRWPRDEFQRGDRVLMETTARIDVVDSLVQVAIVWL